MDLNMDVRPDQLIDIALTSAQVIVAGLLGMVAYSWRTRKVADPADESVFLPIVAGHAQATAASEPIEGKHTIQFVSLAPKLTDRQGGIRDSLIEARRRNRADIIRQARQLIEQGNGNDDISRQLRMTEGELSLLRNEMKR